MNRSLTAWQAISSAILTDERIFISNGRRMGKSRMAGLLIKSLNAKAIANQKMNAAEAKRQRKQAKRLEARP